MHERASDHSDRRGRHDAAAPVERETLTGSSVALAGGRVNKTFSDLSLGRVDREVLPRVGGGVAVDQNGCGLLGLQTLGLQHAAA